MVDQRMVGWVISISALAHPSTESSAAADPRLRASEEAFAGPMGCFETTAVQSWVHESGSFRTTGSASAVWRFDHRTWRLDRYLPAAGDPDSAAIRIAPLLLGRLVATGLRYPTTPHRIMDWPAPVATLPARSFGQVETSSLDALADGTVRVVQGFAWEGWKDVTGERAVTFDPGSRAIAVRMDTTDRWRNRCSVRSVGAATLDPAGLPEIETWSFEGRCPFRDWTAQWRLDYGDWRPCSHSGPAGSDSVGDGRGATSGFGGTR